MEDRMIRMAAVVGAWLLAGAGIASAQASLQGIGHLGTSTRSYAYAVSDDGATVLGGSYFGYDEEGHQAFVWTQAGGLVPVAFLPAGGQSNFAGGISADGSTVVGWGNYQSGAQTAENGFYSLNGGAATGIGDLAQGADKSVAAAASANGAIIVGWGTVKPDNGPQAKEALQWDATNGVQSLGTLWDPPIPPPGGHAGEIPLSQAYDVSDDGSVIVGKSLNDTGMQAFSWTSGSGMQALADLAGGPVDAAAYAVSGNGLVIVGRGTTDSGSEAVRWDAGAATALGDLPGGADAGEAWGVSQDGSVIVGRSETDAGWEAFIWSAGSGMQRLEDVLSGLGVNLTGWTRLTAARDVSQDGTVIVGYGINASGENEGWIATLQ
jgi:probable HAF family extracellular repeat protein